MPKLKPKQEAFVEEFLVDGNGARAARAAGYSEKYSRQAARQLVATKSYVKEAINEKLKERAAVADGSFEWMESKLINAAEKCSTDDDFNPHGLVQTVGLLAKLKGFMSDKIQLEANVKNHHNIDMIRSLEVDTSSRDAMRLLLDRQRSATLQSGDDLQ